MTSTTRWITQSFGSQCKRCWAAWTEIWVCCQWHRNEASIVRWSSAKTRKLIEVVIHDVSANGSPLLNIWPGKETRRFYVCAALQWIVVHYSSKGDFVCETFSIVPPFFDGCVEFRSTWRNLVLWVDELIKREELQQFYVVKWIV